MNGAAVLRQFATFFLSSGTGLGQIAANNAFIGTRLSAARSLEGVRYMNKKIPLLTLGAALIAVPVLAAPGGGDRSATQTRAEVQSKAAEMLDRKSVGEGKRGSVSVDIGGRRIIKKK